MPFAVTTLAVAMRFQIAASRVVMFVSLKEELPNAGHINKFGVSEVLMKTMLYIYIYVHSYTSLVSASSLAFAHQVFSGENFLAPKL